MITFGDRLRQRRIAAGLSQIQLAGSDLSPSYVSLLESGKRQPSREVIEQLALRLGCTPADLDVSTGDGRRQVAHLELAHARLALVHGDPADARERMQALLSGGELDRSTEDEARLVQAHACELEHDLEGAVRVLLPLHERCRSGGTHLPLYAVGLPFCRCLLDAGDLNAAVRIGQATLDALLEAGLSGTDEHLQLLAILMRANVELGQSERALGWADQLVELIRHGESLDGQARAYWQAASTAEQRGDLDQALHLCDRASARLAEVGGARIRDGLRITAARALMQVDAARAGQVADLLDQGLPEIQLRRSPVGLGIWESTRATAALLLDRADEAESLGRQALEHLGDDAVDESVRAMLTLGDALLALHREGDAAAQYTAATELLEQCPPNRVTSGLWREVADRLARDGRITEAMTAYGRALDCAGVRNDAWQPLLKMIERGVAAAGADPAGAAAGPAEETQTAPVTKLTQVTPRTSSDRPAAPAQAHRD